MYYSTWPLRSSKIFIYNLDTILKDTKQDYIDFMKQEIRLYIKVYSIYFKQQIDRPN